MSDKEKLISEESVEATRNVIRKDENDKVPWYFASGFLLFWGLLFFAISIPFFYRLPTALTMEDAKDNVFIAERAYKNLYTLSNIGNKFLGSKENDIDAVQFILKEVNKIKEDSLKEFFDMEIDLSQVSGTFERSILLMVYQGVQNIVVKLTPKNSRSESYLLVNSHFDSEKGPGASDAGSMIVTMLEVLRVIATTKQTFDHPIVFLFNGAEESGLQGSHGFLTQHKWAPNCKAVINLDAGGSGSRELLFRSGPNHPWLMNYYGKYIKHPFATTMAEEIFDLGIIPSDTDFRQFKNTGNIPGLDMAQIVNGFVYHSKYDTIDVIPRESIQNTGDNILSLVRGLSNATELYDTEAHKSGHSVFFDFLGLYFIHYSETTGKYLNFSVSVVVLVLVFISMWRMSAVSEVAISNVVRSLILILIIQVISVVLALALPLVVAYEFDSLGLSLTYFSTPLLVIGLYVCPSLIGLSVPLSVYYTIQRNDKISTGYHLQLAVHAQAIIFCFLAISLTLLGYRSTYALMIPLIFYVLSLALNLLTTLHDRGYAWIGLLKASQIIPFIYSGYLFYLFIVMLTPNGNRSGTAKWDTYIAAVAAAGTIVSFGLLIPLINTFRRPSIVVFTLIATTALAMYLASSTQIGFPFRPKTNGQRVEVLQARNKFYDYDGTISQDESGYLLSFLDRREETSLFGTNVNLTGLVGIKSNCEKHMMCGVPFYNLRKDQSKWLPRSEPIEPPPLSRLEMVNKTILNSTTVRFEFQLTGPSIMRVFIQAEEDVTITNWSFLQSYLENASARPLPYLIFFTYGADSSPFKFYLDCSKSNGNFNVPLFQLGLTVHYMGYEGDAQSVEFTSTFPSYAMIESWPALYERYVF